MFIHYSILEGLSRDQKWFFVEIYGHPEVEKKWNDTWDDINLLCGDSNNMCLVMDHFNEILCVEEK